jgi:alcohol dehydrogenase class IV
MLPALVIADPALTVGLPGPVTAATGMDALSHNLEAFSAPVYHPMARGIAVEGIRMIRDWLAPAVKDGDDLHARAQMMAASTMGATAFQRGLGAMHALAHPLGALYDAHHGMLNAVVMPYVLAANRSAILHDVEYLAACLGLTADFDAFLDWVLELRREIGIPNALSALGIDDGDADRVAQMAVADPSAATNPIHFDAVTYRRIFVDAVAGHLER